MLTRFRAYTLFFSDQFKLEAASHYPWSNVHWHYLVDHHPFFNKELMQLFLSTCFFITLACYHFSSLNGYFFKLSVCFAIHASNQLSRKSYVYLLSECSFSAPNPTCATFMPLLQSVQVAVNTSSFTNQNIQTDCLSQLYPAIQH